MHQRRPSMYQFALNNPVSFSDPTGELAWCLAAGAISVAAGAGIDAAFDDDYTLSDGAIDFTLGSLTCGAGTLLKTAATTGIRGVHLSTKAAVASGAAFEFGLVSTGETTRSVIDQGELAPGRAVVSGGVSTVIGLGVPTVGSRLSRLGQKLTKSFGLGRPEGRLIPDKQLEHLRPFLAKHRVELHLNDDAWLDRVGGNGAFNVRYSDFGRTAELKLRSQPTYLEFAHEMSHFFDWKKIGGPSALVQPYYQGELAVFMSLIKKTRWQKLSGAEKKAVLRDGRRAIRKLAVQRRDTTQKLILDRPRPSAFDRSEIEDWLPGGFD